jgi:hypothetical protein
MISKPATRVLLLCVASALSIALAGCSGAGRMAVRSPASAQLSGFIVRVGGPVSPGGAQPNPVPVSATAVVFHATPGQASISGKPVAEVLTSGSAGGRFTLHLAPGGYVVVAESPTGARISASKRVSLIAGATSSVTLIIPVP